MAMAAQPEGTSRERLTSPVIDTATGKPFPPSAFTIYFTDPDHGKVKIGETHRLQEGTRRGHWEPRTAVPRTALKDVEELLEPLKRHNDAIEHLLELWHYAKKHGWRPEGAPEATSTPEPGGADRHLEPVSAPPEVPEDLAARLRESMETPLEDLPEMPGIPVVPVPPGMGLADFQIPAAAKTDGATSVEAGAVTRIIPAGHPDDPSSGDFLAARAAGIPAEPPGYAGEVFPGSPAGTTGVPFGISEPGPPPVPEVILADDWLNQPATPAPQPAFAEGDFPLDFPSDDDRHPVL